MRFGVVVFPGSNCDHDTLYALRDVTNQESFFLWHKEHDLKDADCIVLPGGFSYGDYLRSGAIARFSPLMQQVKEFALSGGLVLGICNGFQVLLELGLLPGAMLRNKNLKFLCQYVPIRIENTETPFTNRGKPGQVLHIPIAHFDGNYYTDPENLKKIHQNQQVVFRYANPDGSLSSAANVNGSMDSIAGLLNEQKNVMGMMPHPERASDLLLGSTDGQIIFESIIHYLKNDR
ncbi:MAG: phosphoribosylformylglycinamidine synthase subunit PurQ [Candidatus Aminicenantes bacterium]|nr:phosphoribosylformylglycinamidine synthase subunit PurQ [Candidatus Aminicenantes bacterium]